MVVTTANIATTLLRAAPDMGSIEDTAWSMWIADALRQIKNRLGDPDLLDPENLDFVVREAVAEKARHPEAVSQVSISVDDGSVSKTYNRATGQVTILDEWWELLSPSIAGQRDAFTIRPGGARRQPPC